jgi:hypothetical protein
MRFRNYKKGIGLVEVIVAVFILTIVLSSLFTINNLYLKSSLGNIKSTKGAYLASEAVEAVKTIRDSGWSNIVNIANNTDYYLYFNNETSVWVATSSIQAIDGFSRKFKINNVYRDASGDISNAGTVDPNTKKLETFVSWHASSGQIVEKSLITYISNIFED